MVSFTAIICKFGEQGEKTGWTYVPVPQKTAQGIKKDTKKSFRVKGTLDGHAIKEVALLPMGGGDFILVLNAAMRKAIRKRTGDTLQISIEEDTAVIQLPEDLLACLEDEPAAKAYFFALPPSHRHYYGKWIESAKTIATRTRRIAQTINALATNKGFGEMIRESKQELRGLG